LRKSTYRKLRELNNAQDSRDLRKTPSNHFEKLTGKQHFGYCSIRINDQYRLIFLWQNNNAYELEAIIIHPGEVLREDFLLPLKLAPEKLAKNIKVSSQIIQELIAEKRDLDKDLATRLALYFDMSTEF
ncbi:19588_t:CDS:2, partial [Funneliformis geosporum]